MKRWIFIFLFMFCFISFSQPSLPFHKGVNVTNWFQSSAPQEIHFRKFTIKDIKNIKSLGCDVIRLPINLHAMLKNDGSMELEPLFFQLLDSVVSWCEAENIHLILDNHSFNPASSTLPSIEDTLVAVWQQMANHYRNRGEYLYYEILNEPHGINDTTWGAIQGRVIDSIRAIDSTHYIIVGAANWNSYTSLQNLPVYNDSKLIYTFHFYDPFIFTHQGASWTDPPLTNLAGVPFPYDASRMPTLPSDLLGTWVESNFNNYHSEGTVNELHRKIDIAYNFSVERGVPIYCGEFGVYMPNSPENDRVYWYNVVRQYLEYRNISWTIWDYKGGFGLFEKNSSEQFESDLNIPLLNALGFNTPPQSEPSTPIDSSSILFYDDFIGPNMYNDSWLNGGNVNFFDSLDAANGKYCIHWTESGQYGSIRFRFNQIHDLSYLLSQGALLKFKCKASSPSIKIDVRFVDSKDSVEDHPWRMGKTIDFSTISGFNNWSEITVPLGQMEEKGSYDNGWYPPQGNFDWQRVEYFEIVAEHHSLQGLDLWFDDIVVELMNQNGIGNHSNMVNDFDLIRVYPNPFNPLLNIEIQSRKMEKIHFNVYDLTGKLLYTRDINLLYGKNIVSWKGMDLLGKPIPSGIYFIQLKSSIKEIAKKVIFLK